MVIKANPGPPGLLDSLSVLSTAELIETLKAAESLSKKLMLDGPQTDDQLHALVKERFGMDIPREAVCPEHNAPFEFLADLYFERVNRVILMANRGGSKTTMAALLHVLNSKFKPGVESFTLGAVESQAIRAYGHVLRFLKMDGRVQNVNEHPEIDTSIMRETKWKNGSSLTVAPATMNTVNGPHPQKVHFDEVELADRDVFYESRSMSLSSGGIVAQDFITSTRKGLYGLMQQLINEADEAERAGVDPPFTIMSWCLFDTAETVSNCMVAYPDLLYEKSCKCDRVVKGKWDDDSPRRFNQVCKGRLARSKGWISLFDIHKTFQTSSQEVWEAQHECTKPSLEGLVLPKFDEKKQGIRNFSPDPSNGPVFAGLDFGGTNPFAAEYCQLLRNEIEVEGYHGETIRMKEGSVVFFDEIYMAEISNNQFAELIANLEQKWTKRKKGFRVARRFPDPQGKAARLDLARYKTPIRTSFLTTRDVKEQVKKVKSLFEDDRFYFDIDKCPWLCDEAEVWHYPKKKTSDIDDPEIPVDDFDHTMSCVRYVCANIVFLEQKNRAMRGIGTPASGASHHLTADIRKEAKEELLSSGPKFATAPRLGTTFRENARPI